MSKYIDMTLHQRNRFCQDVKASANQINVKNFVVSNDAKYALIKVSCLFWTKVNYDSCLRVRFDCSNCLAKTKSVTWISIELELGRKVAVVDNVQNSISLSVNIYFSKMQCL